MENEANIIELKKRVEEDSKSALDQLIQEGARRMLQMAIERARSSSAAFCLLTCAETPVWML
jgi:hypothetical protein